MRTLSSAGRIVPCPARARRLASRASAVTSIQSEP
jgi:hypothetical protein